MNEKSTEITKWADSAMFRAEPLVAAEGPKVYLLSMSPDPLGSIAAACKMYKGEVVRNLSEITDAERIEYFEQVQKTKLKAPFEFVKFHFMIEGVTRSFTHQMVRQRTAVYAQESLRFAVKEDMAESVALPPSLAGSREFSDILVDVDLGNFDRLSDVDKHRFYWERAVSKIQVGYEDLINSGMPAEDARGLLPHNITTRLHYSTDLRALLDHAGNRLCTQAQFEWRAVFARIIEAIRATSFSAGKFDAAGENANGQSDVYMADRLTDAFKPVCFQTGKCEFKANFDRACKIRDRVDAFEAAGVPSSDWHKEKSERDNGLSDGLDSISPVEWLADPSAAR